jgi:glycosyltransferase involved in cell wall biosynthesis
LRIGVHDYRTDPLLPQKDGVNFAHENISALLRSARGSGLSIEFHDFNALMADLDLARDTLGGLDCVVSNIGPHAQYYFWLRETLGLDFRIVRDVRTAIWSSYLFQEHLLAPLLRPGDTLMVASHYVWAIYRHMFPHLAEFPAELCYPLSVCFPRPRPAERAALPADEVTIGYLGRLSDDKNFPEIVELLIRLNREAGSDKRYRLLACGEIHSATCAPERVEARIASELGEGEWYEYLPARPNEEIWDLLERFDMLLFPSTSNLETFGRVLIEAAYGRVPVIAGRHAAAPELVDETGLCAVDYAREHAFSAHFDHQLGRVDLAEMARAASSGALRASAEYERYADHPQAFLAMVQSPPPLADPALTPSQAAFIAALDVDLPPLPTHDEAMEWLPEHADWFVDLQRKGTPEYQAKMARLLELSRYPERTERFIGKSATTSGDFTNVGGIDIELCHLRGFYPEFSLRSA